MKKLFVLLAVASLGFVSCNNSASEDDAQKKADSTRVADSIKHVQDSIDAAQKPLTPDTTKPADTTKPKQ